MSDIIAQTPNPRYYAVIFTSLRTEGDRGYVHVAKRLVELPRMFARAPWMPESVESRVSAKRAEVETEK